jgi:hypothetical protein
MGGHAFHDLHCPRFSPDVYANVKRQTTATLRTIFSHVVVPTEMPEKHDFGDIDFLVSGPLYSHTRTSIDNFDWVGTVAMIKSALNTTHGRRGFLNPGCMYFAIRAPGDDNDFWVQVDLKVCFKPEMFEWETFELSYASNSKMIGSMVKPLGLTIDPEGLHIRVEEMDETNFPSSMVWVSKDPRDVLRFAGLDMRIVNAGFKTQDESEYAFGIEDLKHADQLLVYEYFASSWLFNSRHFGARLAEEKYYDRLEDRSPHWTYFIKTWVPNHYPGHPLASVSVNDGEFAPNTANQEFVELQAWYKRTRSALREKVFTMFPHVATQYYTKRAAFVREQEERRLRVLITAAIPVGDSGWKYDFPQPHIIVKQPTVDRSTPGIKPTAAGERTPPLTPIEIGAEKELHLSSFILPSPASFQHTEPWNMEPLYLESLPRDPPQICTPHPPPTNMSLEAKLTCLSRWTLFDPNNGTPYLFSAPRDKDFQMNWTEATYLGASEEKLVQWAKDMWWNIWIRQSHTNYVGMWKKRFEKEDRKMKKLREGEEVKLKAEEMVKADREKIMRRLKALNGSLGLVE